MSRLSKDEHFLQMASLVSERGTCARRKVGAVLVDSLGHVLSTGYNGPPLGIPHCIDTPCSGANLPSGQGLDKCQAVHAEQNALLQCKDVNSIAKAYVTASPCIHCVKLLLNTSCQEIIFSEEYPHSESQGLWEMSGRKWHKL